MYTYLSRSASYEHASCEQSIRRINIAEANYLWHCDLGKTDVQLANDLERLIKAKQEHRAQFGSLNKDSEGDWY